MTSARQQLTPRKPAAQPVDLAIGRLARAQHGLVAAWQLQPLGLSASGARSRASRGRLRKIHQGVYATGHAPLTPVGRVMAAVLACGPRAVASHRAAAQLHELRLGRGSSIDVSTPSRTGRGRPGIRVHQAAQLHEDDRSVVDGVPCTALARTLLDVAGGGPRRDVERACDRAALLRTLDVTAIDAALQRAAGCRGAPLLRAVLREHRAASTVTRNDLEELFLALCRAGAMAPDAVNLWIAFPGGAGAEVDFAWLGPRLVAEVDGRDPHTTRMAFEHDRRRDQQLMLLGWRVVRFTWRQVVGEPGVVADALRALLDPRRTRAG